jgi:2-hydroxycyclohexanecarboxyl-CoA dehydrogenase
MGLTDKVAVVTGGGRGLGRAIALRLARDGAAVAVWGRTLAPLEETVALIEAAGGKAVACTADMAVKADIDAAVAQTRAALGPVTILVNNAGLAPFKPFSEVTEADLAEVLQINVTGPFLCTQAIVPDMLAAGWGRIVNISSITAQDGNGMGGQVHYAASKGAVISMTRALAMDYADKGITVNHIPPFFVESPRLSEVVADYDAVAPHTPMKRVGRAEEIAGGVAFLVSDDAAYFTGQALNVNGGRYLQ